MHPSENEAFLLTRVLAYALNYGEDVEFSPGLSNPDEPAIRIPGVHGKMRLWIDIGNPAPKRIHKASKAAERVKIYTYKDPESLKREVAGDSVHRADEIEIYAIDPKFLDALAKGLERDNHWTVIYNDGELAVDRGGENLMTAVVRHSFA